MNYPVTATTNAIVSWTPPTWGWHLQSAPALSGVWTSEASGELNPARVTTTNGATFYRLADQ